VLLATVIGVLSGTPASYALPEDADQPIHIRADRAELDQTAERIVYRGSVRVDQGSMRVDADQITVEYKEQKVIRIVADGEPASYRQELLDPPGEVVARAATIIYHTHDERLELQGSAFMTQQGNEIRGESILYDIVLGKVEAISGEDRPVEMILQPAIRTR
jgi:lipopolysaccharide export system protein LptA